MASTDKEKWVNAMEKEMKSLYVNRVWDIVKARKSVGNKWVYKIKRSANSTIKRHKVSLIVQGFLEKFGQGFNATFAPSCGI